MPTLLLGDLNFPDEAIAALLRRKGLHVDFLPVPYPTNICPGSWLPKRIDTIVLLSPSKIFKVRVLSAEEVLAKLGEATQMLFPTRRGVKHVAPCVLPTFPLPHHQFRSFQCVLGRQRTTEASAVGCDIKAIQVVARVFAALLTLVWSHVLGTRRSLQ